jgi:hypothetical protein
MATRPSNGRQAAQQGTRLAVVTLVFAVLELLLGVLFPPLFLLGAEQVSAGEQQMLDRVRAALGWPKRSKPRSIVAHTAPGTGARQTSCCRRVQPRAVDAGKQGLGRPARHNASAATGAARGCRGQG